MTTCCIVWGFYMATMGRLDPVKNSPIFTSVEECQAELTKVKDAPFGLVCWGAPGAIFSFDKK